MNKTGEQIEDPSNAYGRLANPFHKFLNDLLLLLSVSQIIHNSEQSEVSGQREGDYR